MNMLAQLKREVQDELLRGILPYWMEKMTDEENGGFYGRIDGYDRLYPDEPKGAILNTRILWTFSSAYRTFPDNAYLQTAQRAYNYIVNYFLDKEHGGVYWLLEANGSPADRKKQIYAQAFCIYAFSEYYMASNDESALTHAKELYRLIEKHSFDKERNGYLEAFSGDWGPLDDLRLSDKDENEKKTMNTHLHILEAYTNLYRVWKDKGLEGALRNLIRLFLDRIISNESHLILFFDEEWNTKNAIHSYGHDIEAAWLLYEAASVLGDDLLTKEVWDAAIGIGENLVREGLQPDGSIIYEKNLLTGHTDTDRHWWPQAEAVVGFLYLYKLTGEEKWLHRSFKAWAYINENLVDKVCGEWYWSITNEKPNLEEDKAGFWKCPYHNGRMCLEILRT